MNFGYLVGKKSILIDLVEGIFSLEDRNVKMHTNQEFYNYQDLKYKSMMTIIMFVILLRKGGFLLIEEWIFKPTERKARLELDLLSTSTSTSTLYIT